jgi:hypothetical protein
MTGDFTAPLNTALVLIDNQGPDPISGAFFSLPEGTVFTADSHTCSASRTSAAPATTSSSPWYPSRQRSRCSCRAAPGRSSRNAGAVKDGKGENKGDIPALSQPSASSMMLCVSTRSNSS